MNESSLFKKGQNLPLGLVHSLRVLGVRKAVSDLEWCVWVLSSVAMLVTEVFESITILVKNCVMLVCLDLCMDTEQLAKRKLFCPLFWTLVNLCLSLQSA